MWYHRPQYSIRLYFSDHIAYDPSQAARDLQRFRRCRSELEKSQSLLTRCLQEMVVALNYNSYDMFTREPVLDMMEYQSLTRMLL
jgi:hypothetical protein